MTIFADSEEQVSFPSQVIDQGGGVGPFPGDRLISSTAGIDLEDLDDVNITSPTRGQVVAYNPTGDIWENTDQTGGGDTLAVTDITLAGQETGSVNVTLSGGNITPHSIALNQSRDVSWDAATNGVSTVAELNAAGSRSNSTVLSTNQDSELVWRETSDSALRTALDELEKELHRGIGLIPRAEDSDVTAPLDFYGFSVPDDDNSITFNVRPGRRYSLVSIR